MSEPAVGWLGDAEAKPAPEPLTRIQALINTVDLESGADRLAEPADARPWLVAHGLLADVLRYGAERGDFVVEDADAAALVLSSLVDGLSIQATLGGLDRAGMLRLLRQTARRLVEPA